MSPLSALRSRIGPYGARVVAVSGLVLLAIVIVWVLSTSSRGSYELRAQFDDVRGLIPGGEVRAGAITVGHVTSVELSSEDVPEVTMQIEDDFDVHEGATADIRLGSNVGAVNRTVELTEGDTTRPELADGTLLATDRTDQPVNFDLAVQTLDPATRADVKEMLFGLEAAVAKRGLDIDRTLRTSSEAANETAALLGQVSRDGEALRTLVSESRRIVSAFASEPGVLSEAADRTSLLLETTGRRQADLARSVDDLGPALSETRVLLERLSGATPNLRELVSGLRPVVTELGPLARILPDASAAAGPFLSETRRLIEGGPDDLRAFDPVIDAATPVTKDLLVVAEKALPLGQEIRVYGPEIIGAFQNFGAANGTFDAVGHMMNAAVGDAQMLPMSTASDEIGPDECTPGLLERPYIRLPGTLQCEPWEDFEDSFIDASGSRVR